MLHPKAYAEKNPEKPAYIMAESGEAVTYRQLEQDSNRIAHFFRDLGLNHGDCIAIFMENHPRYFEIVWAAQRTGLRYTPISYHLTPPEVAYIVKDCKARVFLTSHAKADVAANLVDQMPGVDTMLMLSGTIPGYEGFEEKIDGYPSTPVLDEVEGHEMFYSSGTTGFPKGIIKPFQGNPLGEISSLAKLVVEHFGFDTDTVYLSPQPLYHSVALRTCTRIHRTGGTVITMERFDALTALSLIEKYRVTHSQWVPTMFIRMLKLSDEERTRYDLSSHKVAIHGAAPCPVRVKEQMLEWWGPILDEYYSGTESNILTFINSEEWLAHKGSVGRLQIGIPHILDEDENELPPGEVGIIYVEGGTPFEYHNDPEKTAKSRSSKGWTTMNDMGYLDKDGYLYLVDRRTDLIISGGVNIYPQEAENVLVSHQKLFDAAVFGVPHEEFGEEVKAVVQPINMADAGSELEQELIAYGQKRLAKIKCPKSVDFVEKLPRADTGKILKAALKDRYRKQA